MTLKFPEECKPKHQTLKTYQEGLTRERNLLIDKGLLKSIRGKTCYTTRGATDAKYAGLGLQ